MKPRDSIIRRLMTEMLTAVVERNSKTAENKLNDLTMHMTTLAIDNQLKRVLKQKHRAHLNKNISVIALEKGLSQFSNKIQLLCGEAPIQMTQDKDEKPSMMKTRTSTTRRLMTEMVNAVIERNSKAAESKLNELAAYMKKFAVDHAVNNDIEQVLHQQHREHANQTISEIASDVGLSQFLDKINEVCREAAVKLTQNKQEMNSESDDKGSNHKRKMDEQEQPQPTLNKKPKALNAQQKIKKVKPTLKKHPKKVAERKLANKSEAELIEGPIVQSIQPSVMLNDANQLLSEIRKRSAILGNIFSDRYRSQNKNPNKISGKALIHCLQRALQVIDAINEGGLNSAFKNRLVVDASVFLNDAAIKKNLDEIILLDKTIHLVDAGNRNIKKDSKNIPDIRLDDIDGHPALLRHANRYSIIYPYYNSEEAGLNPKSKSFYEDFKSEEAYDYCDKLFRDYDLSGSVFQKKKMQNQERSCFLSDTTTICYDDLTEESVYSVLYAVGVVHFLSQNEFSMEGLTQVFNGSLPFLALAPYTANTSFFELASDGGEEKSISPKQFFDSLAADKTAMKKPTLLDSVKDVTPKKTPTMVLDEPSLLERAHSSYNVSFARSPFGTFGNAAAKSKGEIDPMIQIVDEDEINPMLPRWVIHNTNKG